MPEIRWSRGRELNPRPTDYEAEGRLLAGPQRFCSLRRNCSLRFDVHTLLSRDTGAFSRQSRTRDHIVSRVVQRKIAQAIRATISERSCSAPRADVSGTEGRESGKTRVRFPNGIPTSLDV